MTPALCMSKHVTIWRCHFCKPTIIYLLYFVYTDRGYYHGSFVPAAPQSGDKVCIPVLESYVNLDGPFPDRHNVHYE